MPEDQYQVIASVTDSSNGYQITITRIDRSDYDVQYMLGVHPPNGGGPLESHTTAPLRSDGTGFPPPLRAA